MLNGAAAEDEGYPRVCAVMDQMAAERERSNRLREEALALWAAIERAGLTEEAGPPPISARATVARARRATGRRDD